MPAGGTSVATATTGTDGIPGLGETQYLLPGGQLTSTLPSGYAAGSSTSVAAAASGAALPAAATGGSGASGASGASGPQGGGGATSTATATVAAGTSGNPFVDAAEWSANLIGLVPLVGPGIAAVLTDGVQAVAYMTHDLAYALDTAVSVFKPGQAWRAVFGAVAILLAVLAFRAWTGRSLMPAAPAVIPV
jgi:hypothetical protein